ncbi:MAG: L-seryl-tRNA(Sec) selenium transferase [Acidobacteriota bacterium]
MKSVESSKATGAEKAAAAQLLRSLPAVGQVLEAQKIRSLFPVYGREAVRVQVRLELDRLRQWLVGRDADAPADESPPTENSLRVQIDALPQRAAAALAREHGAPLRRVLNATGVFLHTNLGRAALPLQVARAMPEFLDASCDLEMSLEKGRRANRNSRVEGLLRLLTGAESAVVVNNNAAALVLLLQHTSLGREVIVSRGELVEIGGSFRIPSILETAGTRLREVGTTNRTRIDDYAAAVSETTGALLKVHPSNYRISGFTEGTSPAELVALGQERGVPVLIDEGSGLLRCSDRPQLRDHDSLSKLVAAGVDAACGSGDKLVGGPQAGLIVGKSALVDAVKKHPLYRALRPNRGTLFALESVLRLHLAEEPLPIDRLWTPEDQLLARLEPLARAIDAEIVASDAFVGGGAAPEAPIAGHALAIEDSGSLLEALRTGPVPVVGFLRDGQLMLDLRTVDPQDDERVVAAVCDARERVAGAKR